MHSRLLVYFNLVSCLLWTGLHAGSAQETTITSDRLEKRTVEGQDRFYFYDNVQVVSQNMTAQCDTMEVFTEGRAGQGGTGLEMGAIRVIYAKGHVVIEQAGRKAYADAAEILPADGKVVLMGRARVVDKEGTVEGHKITLLKGEERAIVEGGASGGRPKVILPSIPDLGASAAKPSEKPEVVENKEETP
ncbi:MAG TPA: hypothetical protein DIU37_04715 [Opitutae bacterium]|nr:hypothetical protein [Opitutae bacterium]|tara:strand:- start:1528 stop:2097 length:570 start_codon:yes stop_codon:yes gene_type:complete